LYPGYLFDLLNILGSHLILLGFCLLVSKLGTEMKEPMDTYVRRGILVCVFYLKRKMVEIVMKSDDIIWSNES
jgi:hypothetical protein